MEEGYKRDTELFRTEAMKRDMDFEEEKAKCDAEINRIKSQVE